MEEKAESADEARHSELTAEVHDAYAKGDRETAQRLLAEQGALSARLWPDDGERPPATEGEFRPEQFEVPDLEDGALNGTMQAMELADPEATRALVAEWGDGPNTAANMRYAAGVAKHFADQDGSLRTLLNTTVEDENGHEWQLGNHPALIRLAAKVGRMLKHGGETGMPKDLAQRFMAQTHVVKGRMGQGEDMSPEEAHSELTRQMIDAHHRGDHDVARRLDKRRSELSRQIGDGPIVGGSGRTA